MHEPEFLCFYSMAFRLLLEVSGGLYYLTGPSNGLVLFDWTFQWTKVYLNGYILMQEEKSMFPKRCNESGKGYHLNVRTKNLQYKTTYNVRNENKEHQRHRHRTVDNTEYRRWRHKNTLSFPIFSQQKHKKIWPDLKLFI